MLEDGRQHESGRAGPGRARAPAPAPRSRRRRRHFQLPPAGTSVPLRRQSDSDSVYSPPEMRKNPHFWCSSSVRSHLYGLIAIVRPLSGCAQTKWKKRSERRKHCALAVVRQRQNLRPAADPLPGGAGRPKVNQLEMVTTFTYKPSLVKIDARNLESSWKQRPPARPLQTHRQDR